MSKASGSDGSYFPVSIDRLPRDPESLGQIGLRPITLGAKHLEAILIRPQR